MAIPWQDQIPRPGLGSIGAAPPPPSGGGLLMQPTAADISSALGPAPPQLGSIGAGPVGGGPGMTADQLMNAGAPGITDPSLLDRGFGTQQAAPQQAQQLRDPSMLESEMARQNAEREAIAGFLGSDQTYTTPDARYPILERQAIRHFGRADEAPDVPPFQPQPPPELPRNEGETDEEYATRVEFFGNVDLRQQREVYDKTVADEYARTKDISQIDVGEIGEQGVIGMQDAQLQAAGDVGGAEIEQQQQVADTMKATAGIQRDAVAQAQDADTERRERARYELEEVTRLQGAQEVQRKRVAELPELDRDRVFRNMTTGNKVWAMIGAVASGAIGHDFVGSLRQWAMDDLAEQKANNAQTMAQYDAATGAVQQQSGLYQDLLRTAGDEQIADSMWLQLQLEDAANLLEGQIAETTVPVMQASLQQELVGLRQQIDAEGDKIQMALATTPREKVHHTISARQRKQGFERMETLDAQRQDLVKLGVKGTQDLDKVQATGEMKARLEGEKEAKRQGFQEKKWIAEKTAAPREEITAIDNFYETYGGREGDIPGQSSVTPFSWVGLGDHELTEEARQAKRELNRIVFLRLRPESGAAIKDDEIERDASGIVDAMNENDIWNELDMRRNEAARKISYFERAPSEGSVSDYRRAVGPEFDPLGAAAVEDPTIVD